MTTKPLVIYLDTQDYIRVFNEPEDGPSRAVLDQVLNFRDQGRIVIGYSWGIMLEFITRPTVEYREERVRRGQLVKDICGRNAFPFLSDLKKGSRFPNDGHWMTPSDDKVVSAQYLRNHLTNKFRQAVKGQPGLNRTQRRRLKTKSGMNALLRQNTSTWGSKREDFGDLPVSNEFIESGILLRFIKGRCSDAEFEQRLNLWFSDPAEFSRIAYDYADQPNLMDKFFGTSLVKIEESFKKLQEHLCNLDAIDDRRRELRQDLIEQGLDRSAARRVTKPVKRPPFDYSGAVQKMESYLGEGRAGHIGHYLLKASRKDYRFLPSDFLDIAQMCYVQDCDLFRCDRAMADLYKDYEPFAGKLVSRFTDLPGRIERLLGNAVVG